MGLKGRSGHANDPFKVENNNIAADQVEILVNEPYSGGPGPDGDGKGSGQFTHKVYHIGRYKVLQPLNAISIFPF